MIVTYISEGLGNQMFQYAAALRLAHRHGVALKLDNLIYFEFNRRPFRNGERQFTVRRYALDAFRISAPPATRAEIERYRRYPRRGLAERWGRLRERLRPRRRSLHLVEPPDGRFEPALLDAPADCYVQGYWQSEEYFTDAADLVRAEFAFRTQPDGAAGRLREMADGDAVSLHVRRGDKAWRKDIKTEHGVLPLDYYLQAVRRVADRVAEPRFYVFSDDLPWARENLRLPFPLYFVDDNVGKPDHEDLRLMSACKHHILANSTFSWWGAWLRPDPDSVVVAPERWTNAARLQNARLLPERWEKIATPLV